MNHLLLEKVLKKIIVIGSFFIVFVPLLVVPGSYFPYIIQKTIILRTLIELIFAAYLVLALWKPEYRPQRSHLFWSVVAFFAVMVLTTFTSQSVDRSWWGNWERSFGTFNYLHYLAWFIVLISVFKENKYWQRLLNFTLIVSAVISLYSIAQRFGLSLALQSGLERVNGTIGNASFLASYMLLHIFLALFFLFERKKWPWKLYYLGIFILDFFVLILTGTRGAFLALFFSLIGFILLTFLFKLWRVKGIKILLFICLTLLLVAGVLYYYRDTDLIKGNYWLRRLTGFSLDDNTVKTRLYAWEWGLKGFRDNLIFGVGPENYQNIFNRYFDADFLNYSRGEIWFDHAHNTLVDMASMMGIFGLLSYLSIFALLFYSLVKLKKSGALPPLTFLILFLLFFSYFFQNIFVFDSLNNLIVFYLFLAFIHYLSCRVNNQEERENKGEFKTLKISPYFTLPLCLALFLFAFFGLNLKEIKANKLVYNAYVSRLMNKYEGMVEQYEEARNLSVNKVDPAILLSSSLNETTGRGVANISQEQKIADLNKAVSWMDEAIALDPQNMFLYYLQGKNYSLLTEISGQIKYVEKGIAVTEKAKELSPGRVRPLWLLGQLYLFAGQNEKALNYLDQAASFNPNLPETYFYKSIIYRYLNDDQKLYEQIDLMIDHEYEFVTLDQIREILPHYDELKDVKRLIYLLGQLTLLESDDPNNWDNLVDLLVFDGQYERALSTLKNAASAIPSFSNTASARYQQILKIIESQKNNANNAPDN